MSNVFIDGDQVHIKGLVDTDVVSVHSRDAAARISADLRASAAADVRPVRRDRQGARGGVMSAEKLREAAKVLRERAECAGNRLAFPHPWGVREPSDREFDHVGIAAIVTTNPEDNGEVTDWIDVDCATYIATMHPGVGLVLADWLDDEARAFEHPQKCDDARGCCNNCEYDASVLHAIAVADAILGGAQ